MSGEKQPLLGGSSGQPGYPASTGPGHPASGQGYPAAGPGYPASGPGYPATSGKPSYQGGPPAAGQPPTGGMPIPTGGESGPTLDSTATAPPLEQMDRVAGYDNIGFADGKPLSTKLIQCEDFC